MTKSTISPLKNNKIKHALLVPFVWTAAILSSLNCSANAKIKIEFDSKGKFPANINRESYINYLENLFNVNYGEGFINRTNFKKLIIENKPNADYAGITLNGSEIGLNIGGMLPAEFQGEFPISLEREEKPSTPPKIETNDCNHIQDPTALLNCQSYEELKKKLSEHSPQDPFASMLQTIQVVFHHEFMHVVDHSLDKESDRELKKAWRNANPPNFIYRSELKSQKGDVPFFNEGFLMKYAQLSIGEDIATTHGNFVMNPKYYLEKYMNDPILRKKFELVKRMLESICNKPLRKSRTKPDQSRNQSCAIPDAYRLI